MMSAAAPSITSSIKDFFNTFFLVELLKGMKLTGRHALFERKITIQFPEEKTPLSPRFSPWYSRMLVSTIESTGQLSSQKPQKMHLNRSMS